MVGVGGGVGGGVVVVWWWCGCGVDVRWVWGGCGVGAGWARGERAKEISRERVGANLREREREKAGGEREH